MLLIMYFKSVEIGRIKPFNIFYKSAQALNKFSDR